MFLKQEIFAEDLVDLGGDGIFVTDMYSNSYKIKYDLHLPNGQRIHIIYGNLENMFVWNDAIIFGENHLHVVR